jgi:hypothetical protein
VLPGGKEVVEPLGEHRSVQALVDDAAHLSRTPMPPSMSNLESASVAPVR